MGRTSGYGVARIGRSELRSTTTQLYHMGERWYNPRLGCWTQQDPISSEVSDLSDSSHCCHPSRSRRWRVRRVWRCPSRDDRCQLAMTERYSRTVRVLGAVGLGFCLVSIIRPVDSVLLALIIDLAIALAAFALSEGLRLLAARHRKTSTPMAADTDSPGPAHRR